jgi:hypothetical protein
MITGQALAGLGAEISGAIQAKKQKKAEADLSKAAAGMVLRMVQANPEQGAALGIESLDDAREAVNIIGAPNLMKFFMQEPEPMRPVSSGTIAAAETAAAAQGYEFNEETGQYEKKVKGEGAGFLGTLGNIMLPGQPFGESYTRPMSPEMLQGISGMEQSQAIQAAESRSGAPTVDPLNIMQ